MAINRYRGEPLDITVQFPSDPLVPYGLSYASVLDVSMCWKANPTTDADDAYLQKTQQASGVVLDEATNTFTMRITSADYDKVEPGSYSLVLAVQVAVDEPWVELGVPGGGITVTPDRHRA